MHPNRLGLPWGAAPAGILEVPDQLLLLGVDRDGRLTGSLERRHVGVDVLELGVAVGVARTFARLAVGLQTEAQAVQQATHQLLAGGEAQLRQRRRQMALALADPQQRGLGIAADRRLRQLTQGCQEPRLGLNRRLAATSRPTHPIAQPNGTRPQVRETATDRARWRSRHPATSPSPRAAFFATVIPDSRRRPAAFDRITEVPHVPNLAGLPQRYLRTPEAARFVGLSIRTLEKHRIYGTGPRYSKLGGRVVYRVEDLQAWVDRGAKASTSDPGVGTVLPAKRHSPDIPAPAGQARR